MDQNNLKSSSYVATSEKPPLPVNDLHLPLTAKNLDGSAETESSSNFSDRDEGDKLHARETWTRKIDFLLACVGFSVGLGNVWRFPYLCYKNGGGAFLIPYFICCILGGIPVFFLEVSLGQFMSTGGVSAWLVCPLFQGIGYATTIIVFLLNIYYNVILAWAFYYLFASFAKELPWSSCGHDWNTDRCVTSVRELVTNVSAVIAGTNATVTESSMYANGDAAVNSSLTLTLEEGHGVDPVTEYWERKVLQISDGIDQVGTIKWDLALCLLLAWIVVYCCICKGIKSSGKAIISSMVSTTMLKLKNINGKDVGGSWLVMYFTATSPYILMFVLMIRGLTLPGAINGVKFYVLPDWSKLMEAQVWVDAGTQIFFSYSISLGALTALGSYNKFHHNSYKDSIIFALTNSGTSFFAGFTIFSVLGFMAYEQGVSVGEVAESGPGLAFIAYPKAVAQMPLAPLWSILFFVMIILLGLDSQFVGVEGFVTAIVDKFPNQLRRGYRKEIFIGIVCIISFFIGLSMVTNGGMYVFQLFDYYSGSRIILIVALFECIVVAWIYGVARYYDNIEMMLGFRINPYMKICWRYITPLFTLVVFSLCIYSYSELTYNRIYTYPKWAIGLGWMLACSSVIMIPLTMTFKILTTPGSLYDRLRILMRPQLKPHQLRPQDSTDDLATKESLGPLPITTEDLMNGRAVQLIPGQTQLTPAGATTYPADPAASNV